MPKKSIGMCPVDFEEGGFGYSFADPGQQLVQCMDGWLKLHLPWVARGHFAREGPVERFGWALYRQ